MKKYKIIAMVLCLLLIVSGCSKAAGGNEPAQPASSDNVQPVETEAPVEEPTQAVVEVICPLTGQPITKEQLSLRPFAVVIDNMASARPQSGLIYADIVYEMPAEGGITRYLAIYHHQEAEKIGPVRSARSYFLDKSMEFNAVFLHCGGSPEALREMPGLKIDSLNELKGEKNYWRARDRKPPHNLYTSTKLTREVMDAKKLAQKKWSYELDFSQSFLELDGKATKKLVIDYKNNYKAGYEYDEAQKLYYRTINGIRLKDKETNAEITTVNIIVEKVSAQVTDEIGRLNLTNTGSGRGYLVTGGKLIEIEWSKESREGKTIYKDLKGNVIQLNKGNSWIQVVPEYATIEF